MESIPITQAKNKLTNLIHEVESSHNPIELTRHGKAAAVLLSAEDYKTLIQSRPSFSTLLERFQDENPGEGLEEDIFSDLRSRDMGRDVEL